MDLTRSEAMSALPTIVSSWETGARFLQSFFETENMASFFHPLAAQDPFPENAPPGALVSVVIRFLDHDNSFHLHAHVVEWRKDLVKGRGLVLRFLPEERPRRDMVVGCAEGESFPYTRRRHERVPCYFPVTVEVGCERRFDAIATDISEGGVFLATAEQLERGCCVSLYLSVPNSTALLALVGNVAHVQRDGIDNGIGIEFLFRAPTEKDKVAEQVQKQRRILRQENAKHSATLATSLRESAGEFRALNARVKAGAATDEERAKWQELKNAYLAFNESRRGHRRRHQRTSVPVAVRVGDAADEPAMMALDLSAGGIRLLLPGSFQIGSVLDLSLQLPGEPQAYSMTARVVWVGENSMTGLEFLDASAAMRDRLDALVWERIDCAALLSS